MKILVDSHVIIWAVDEPSKLSPLATSLLEDVQNDLLLSAASLWELSIKVGLSKLQLSLSYREWMELVIEHLMLTLLPISLHHAEIQSHLPLHHRDPFDRMLISQAIAENIPVVSSDAAFDAYGIARLW
jgi:PIN domain nuclease of toxin-antitoxin system